MKTTSDFLNTYVAPANMISFSIFEDDHPCDNNLYHAVVFFKGKADTPLDKKEIQGDIYSLTFEHTSDGWERLGEQVCNVLDEGGFTHSRYLVSTTNFTDGDGQAFAILKWSKTHEDMFTDNSRGGCSCNIF